MREGRIQSPKRSDGLLFRLILSSFAGLFGVVMLLIAPGAPNAIALYSFGAFCLFIAIACFVRGRVQAFVGSAIAAVVVVLVSWYVYAEITSGPVVSGSRSEPSVLNAAIAFVVFGVPAVAYLLRARFGFGPLPTPHSIILDEEGICRLDGETQEEIRWDDIEEIRILTTDDGPYAEDVFFALVDKQGQGCLVPHELAEENGLLQVLQNRFPGLDDDAVIRAMGCTSNASFLVWRRSHAA